MLRWGRIYTIDPSLYQKEGVTLYVLANDQRLTALVDTGAGSSVIDQDIAQQLGWNPGGLYTARGVTSTGSHPVFHREMIIPFLGETIGPPVRGLPLVANGFQQAIIGRDVLSKYEFSVNGRTGEVRFNRA